MFLVTSTENIPISGSVLTEEPEVFMSKCIYLTELYFLRITFYFQVH